MKTYIYFEHVMIAIRQTPTTFQGLWIFHFSLKDWYFSGYANWLIFKPLWLRIIPWYAFWYSCSKFKPALKQALCLFVKLEHACFVWLKKGFALCKDKLQGIIYLLVMENAASFFLNQITEIIWYNMLHRLHLDFDLSSCSHFNLLHSHIEIAQPLINCYKCGTPGSLKMWLWWSHWPNKQSNIYGRQSHILSTYLSSRLSQNTFNI